MACDICGFVKTNKNPVFETSFWKVFLADDQAYLGRCYVTLKRHAGDLSKLTQDEWDDLLEVIIKLESSVKKAFGATLFNWTCLMNLAYQNNPPNPHIHWHFRPRYSHPVRFAKLTFEDPEFGQHYSREHERSLIVSKNLQQKIIKEIQKF